jgi:hypothetical protein
MIAPGVLVMTSVLPFIEKVTPPATMDAPEGLAKPGVAEAVKAALTAKASARRDGRSRANAPWPRRWISARERRQLRTYPPDPSTNFATESYRPMLRPAHAAFEELRHVPDVTSSSAESFFFPSLFF